MLLLVFHLDEDRYALEGREVVEVVPGVALKAVPHAPDCVAGLFNYRGTIVPVIDLCRLTRGTPCATHLATRIVLVEFPDSRGAACILGLMAERVTEAAEVQAADFKAPGIRVEGAPYLGDVVADEQGMIQRIHVERLLPSPLRDSLFADREHRD